MNQIYCVLQVVPFKIQICYFYSLFEFTIESTCIWGTFFLFLELFKEGFAPVLNSSGVALYDETMDGVYATKLSSTFANNHSQNNIVLELET